MAATETMKLKELYVYPIKSLRTEPLQEAILTKNGFKHDRRFMILKVQDDGTYKNMDVCHFNQMSLFIATFNPDDSGTFTVTYTPPKEQDAAASTIEIPLEPETSGLEKTEVNLHRSCTPAYIMPAKYNDWFSTLFGFSVVLVYLGNHLREILFEDMNPSVSQTQKGSSQPQPSSWLSSITSSILGTKPEKQADTKVLTFADCATYLIASSTSLDAVSSRLPASEPMDVTKFRPNIVLSGALQPWSEDFWSLITITPSSFPSESTAPREPASIRLKHNCVRCKSINVDYTTGKQGTGESGQVLKKLQADRRVDPGNKYSPVFGRYGFLEQGEGVTVRVGDEVTVGEWNSERTSFSWP